MSIQSTSGDSVWNGAKSSSVAQVFTPFYGRRVHPNGGVKSAQFLAYLVLTFEYNKPLGYTNVDKSPKCKFP